MKKYLYIAFYVCIAILAAVYAIAMRTPPSISEPEVFDEVMYYSLRDTTLENYENGRKIWSLMADELSIEYRSPFKNIKGIRDGKFLSYDGNIVGFSASEGTYNELSASLSLKGDVMIKSDVSIINAGEVDVDLKNNLMEIDGDYVMVSNGFNITSGLLVCDLVTSKIDLSEDVRLTGANELLLTTTKASINSLLGTFDASDTYKLYVDGIYLSSGKITCNYLLNNLIATENVVVTKEKEYSLSTQQLIYDLNRGSFEALGKTTIDIYLED